MKRKPFDVLMVQYLDGSISPEELQEFEREIESNSDLRARFEAYRALWQAEKAAEDGAQFSPERREFRALRWIHWRLRLQRRWAYHRKRILAVSGSAALVLAAWLFLNMQLPNQPAKPAAPAASEPTPRPRLAIRPRGILEALSSGIAKTPLPGAAPALTQVASVKHRQTKASKTPVAAIAVTGSATATADPAFSQAPPASVATAAPPLTVSPMPQTLTATASTIPDLSSARSRRCARCFYERGTERSRAERRRLRCPPSFGLICFIPATQEQFRTRPPLPPAMTPQARRGPQPGAAATTKKTHSALTQ